MKKCKWIFFVLIVLFTLIVFNSCNSDITSNSTIEIYDVSNGYFEFVDFDFSTYTSITTSEKAVVSKERKIDIKSKCELPLTECTVYLRVYTSTGRLSWETSEVKKQKIDENTEFTVILDIPDSIYSSMKSIEVTYSGKSTEKPSADLPGEATKKSLCVVTYYDGKTKLATAKVKEGSTIEPYQAPYKNNYTFLKWCSNASKTNDFNFSKEITEDTSIYASYILDAVNITNEITSNTMKSVVTVYNTSYNKNFLGIKKDQTTSQGSGIIFVSDDGYFYVLTNCHVAKKDKNCDYQTITVEDYKGRKYEAQIYKAKSNSTSAISASYDLAAIWFKTSHTDLEPIKYYSSDPQVGDDVISVSTPDGQQNAISYGNVIKYDEITVDTPSYRSNVKFDVMHHDTLASSGSSGGPILNSDLALVGIHFASNKNAGIGAAIPISKIIEFWEKYVM